MKLVTLFILCNTFAVLFAIPFDIRKIGKYFNIGSKCESKDFDFFKSILDKAKAKHPTASNRDLVAFMANDMMDDPINPLVAITIALNGDIKNYTRNAWFLEFYGNSTQFQDFIYGRYDLIACSVEKRYVLKMISRKPIEIENVFIRKMKDMFFSAKANSKFDRLLEIHASALQKRYGYEFSDHEAKDCSEYPKAQAIIDKIEKMGISDLDKWSRLCVNELKATFKTPASYVLKMRGKDRKVSYLFEGEESREEMQNEDIKPKMCQSETKTGLVILMWVEM
uniref:Uncharacterized protein n=1 Tax=Panagrolaimus davidi TaxID=227884 RepID=A0A914Q4H2_9BILA